MWDKTCPAGHTGPFTCYGLAIYSCHQCSSVGEHKFVLRLGKPVWTASDKVPVGLRKMADLRAAGNEHEECASHD